MQLHCCSTIYFLRTTTGNRQKNSGNEEHNDHSNNNNKTLLPAAVQLLYKPVVVVLCVCVCVLISQPYIIANRNDMYEYVLFNTTVCTTHNNTTAHTTHCQVLLSVLPHSYCVSPIPVQGYLYLYKKTTRYIRRRSSVYI